MRYLPGWAVGALSTTAIGAAFVAGGVFGAPNPASFSAAAPEIATTEPTEAAVAQGLEVSCEPRQSAVVRQASNAGAGSVACVSEPAVAVAAQSMTYASAPMAAGMIRVADTSPRPYARPAVINEPIEVYRPRSVPVSYEPRPESYGSRQVARPTRSVKKSAVIIAGSTAAGAVVGGLVKGKKGALIGGIVSGGAATVWDQVTRRRGNDVR